MSRTVNIGLVRIFEVSLSKKQSGTDINLDVLKPYSPFSTEQTLHYLLATANNWKLHPVRE